MSWEFIAFIVVGAIAAVAWIVRAKTPKTRMYRGAEEANEGRTLATTVAIGATAIAALFLFLSSFTIVGTKNVGIQTSFNRPIGTMANGWNWKAPWTDVYEWDGKLQNLAFSDEDIPNVDEAGKGVQVRLANQSVATIDLIFQYRITTDDGVLQLFRDYGSEGAVKDNQVRKALQAVLNEVFGTYDPISALATGGTGRTPTQGMAALGSSALSKLSLPRGLEAVSLTIVLPHYDKQTEDAIQRYNVALQNTAIANQDKVTAQIVKDTNDQLAKTNASDYQQCLSMLERVKKAGGSWDGFQCSATDVIVSAK
jgi:regulator of protease activity HflC (stomatin/prohibitin superfamily)